MAHPHTRFVRRRSNAAPQFTNSSTEGAACAARSVESPSTLALRRPTTFTRGLGRSSSSALLASVFFVAVTPFAVAGAHSELAELAASDAAGGDQFGHDVDVDGMLAVLGAPMDDDAGFASGGAYVFEASGGVWLETAKLVPLDLTSADRFGWSVACDGDTIVASALFGDGASPVSGTAYVHVRSGSAWVQEQKLAPLDGAGADWFGRSVAISGDTIVVGAPQDDDLGLDSGSVYVFTRAAGVWSLQQKLHASDGTIEDSFGESVAIDGDTLVVGAPEDDDAGASSGSMYVFTRAGGIWSEQAKLVASDAVFDDWLGFSVAVSGDRALAGAYRASDGPTASGAAYLFERAGTSWSQLAKLVPDDGVNGDDFGWSVALAGAEVVVGARKNDAAGVDSGAVYRFAESGGSFSVAQKLVGASTAAGDELGLTVATDGALVLGGAYRHDGVGGDSGAAWLFGSSTVGLNYCASNSNSTGGPAVIAGLGSASVAANDLQLAAEPVPAGQPGLFYYGPVQVQLAFGNGFRCVGSGTVGLARLGIVLADAGGRMSWLLDNTAPPIPQATILPGSTWNFQAWFRDPAGGGSFFDLSDGLEVTFSN